MATRISKSVEFAPTIRFGAGGNIYVICKVKPPLKNICIAIGKAQSSVYWSKKHECFAFRVKSKHHKKRLAEV